MINYIQQLSIAKDVENLAPFAIRHSKISKLNKIKNEAFNTNGISSSIYLSICELLYDLYIDDEDYESACDIALNIYQGSRETDNESLKSKAIINLTEAYININDIIAAKKYFKKIDITEDNFYYPQFLVCKSKMAGLEKENDKEIIYLRDAYNHSIKLNNPIEIQINILCALSLCYERNNILEKAFHGYIELTNQIAQNNYQITSEQQISLETRIATIAGITGNYPLAHKIFSTISTVSDKILRKNHPLRIVVNKKFELINTLYHKNTNT